MNWKNEAIDKLRRYDAMRQAAANITDEIERLKLVAEDAAGSPGRREDLLLSNHVHRQELASAMRQAKYWTKQVENAMCVLTAEERLILNRCYIYPERGAIDRLCGELQAECSTVYRKRDRALQQFTVALYGIPGM